ncbi:HAMP domain-containing sensor histidine kinase [Candidatus Solirubrobacter pratensis]|uniref:HAMP domain-containing sensor histidine kinase n=1 Tax=Candidatus Solirubrobacter pratensis TaxID=1298857 RepID=UPI0006841761|nr:HAMP domain-containing sensor histidine kinase [Candidatus Solirubrobacter pratensis]
MIPRALRGLRGRLLLALVATSAVTLAVAAAVTLSPLRERLRQQSVDNQVSAVEDAVTGFESAMSATVEKLKIPEKDKHGRPLTANERRQAIDGARAAHLQEAYSKLYAPASEVRQRTDARVLVLAPTLTSLSGEAPDFLYDDSGSDSTSDAMRVAVQASNQSTQVVSFDGDDLLVAEPLYASGEKFAGVVVAQRRLTEVTSVVGLVRNALIAAAAIGLAVAIGLGLALSGTLTRRLGRLGRAALRITREGPEAPSPRDDGRDEVGDLARALARMQEELRRQEAARRSFVATASHELRTPLTMLQGTMELLDEDLQGDFDLDDAQEQVANARRELRRLSALASELLDLSRLDAAVQLRSEPVELGELARAVGAEFALRAAEVQVPIEVVPPPEPCWAKADPAACARVVRILIDNALRYAPEGEPIVIVTERLGNRVVVEVADRGPGVPEEERERIFERFHRGRAAGAESGFGLGLAIGRELAERMGGTLLLEDSDAGACFQLALPATTGSSPAPSPAPDSAAAA